MQLRAVESSGVSPLYDAHVLSLETYGKNLGLVSFGGKG